MKKRIIGINVARALAIFGMIIVNFKVVLGTKGGDAFLKPLLKILDGKAAATFVVLAGVGLALMSNKAYKSNLLDNWKVVQVRILKRAVFLFILGLSYIWIWPADILHFYGIYMLVTLVVIKRSKKSILWSSVILILIYPILITFFDYELGWNFETLDYANFWSINGFFRNLFFNGFHPVLPWVAFMLAGLWFGRLDLYNNALLKRTAIISGGVFLLIQAIPYIALYTFDEYGGGIEGDLAIFFKTDPMPPLPLYMFNGISIALFVISSCIILARKFDTHWIILTLNKTGQLALTFYVAHVVIGMGWIEEFGSLSLGEYSLEFSFFYAIGFSLLCIVFAELWLKYKSSGPLEWIMRKVCG